MGNVDFLQGLVEDAALELVHKHSLDEIESRLMSNGADSATAERLVLLIPSAFAREYFEPDGIVFPDTFLVGPSGAHVEKPYSQEPIYVAARSVARRWLSESRKSLVLRVLDWSAEAKCVKQAQETGLTPTRMSVVHYGFEA